MFTASNVAFEKFCEHFYSILFFLMGLHRRLSGKEPACQCKRGRFHPWVWKIPWRREWQPTPIFLPGESHGQRNLAGYSSWGCRVRHNLVIKQQIGGGGWGRRMGNLMTQQHILLSSCQYALVDCFY